MFRRSHFDLLRIASQARRLAQPFSKPNLHRAAHVMGPTLLALTFAGVSSGVAHAQGTMDFSSATTLMGTFKTFAIYAGAVICFGGLIFAGIRMMSGRFQFTLPEKITYLTCLHTVFSLALVGTLPRTSGEEGSCPR